MTDSVHSEVGAGVPTAGHEAADPVPLEHLLLLCGEDCLHVFGGQCVWTEGEMFVCWLVA